MNKFSIDKLKNLTLDDVKNIAQDVAINVKPKNDTEKRVHEALSNQNWGASSTLMQEIAKDTFDYEKYPQITKLIWQALDSPGRAWRSVFKGLSLLEFLVKHGSERVIEDARDHTHRLRLLLNFSYSDGGVDRGQGVRDKARQLVELLSSNETIREERQKAQALRNKFSGISNDSYSYSGGGGGSYGGSRYDGFGSDPRGAASYSDRFSGGGGGGAGGYGGSSRPSRYSDSTGGAGRSGRYDESRSSAGEDDNGSSSPPRSSRYNASGSEAADESDAKERKKGVGKISVKINSAKKEKKPKAKAAAAAPASAPAPDLLGGFDDPAPPAAAAPPAGIGAGGFAADFSGMVGAAPAAANPPAGTGAGGFAADFPQAPAAAPAGGFQADFGGQPPAPPLPVGGGGGFQADFGGAGGFQADFGQAAPPVPAAPMDPLAGLQAPPPPMQVQAGFAQGQPNAGGMLQMPMQQQMPAMQQPMQQQVPPMQQQMQQMPPMQQPMQQQPGAEFGVFQAGGGGGGGGGGDFGEFQQGGGGGGGGDFGEFQAVAPAPAAAAQEDVTDSKMKKLVDLGNLKLDVKKKEEPKAALQQKYTDTSFQGLDGFSKAQQPMSNMSGAPLASMHPNVSHTNAMMAGSSRGGLATNPPSNGMMGGVGIPPQHQNQAMGMVGGSTGPNTNGGMAGMAGLHPQQPAMGQSPMGMMGSGVPGSMGQHQPMMGGGMPQAQQLGGGGQMMGGMGAGGAMGGGMQQPGTMGSMQNAGMQQPSAGMNNLQPMGMQQQPGFAHQQMPTMQGGGMYNPNSFF